MPDLFSAIEIKGHKIRNRIVMPPIVCFGWAKADGFVTRRNIEHYEARAKGGTGLIIVEATCVMKDGRLTESQLGIWSDEHIMGLSEIADRCHKHGAKVLIQIHHGGYKVKPSVSENVIAPSNYEKDGFVARGMTLDELHEIQEAFLKAAIRAEKAGFDGVELHGAHGFLLGQFMSPLVNRRKDGYGGSLPERARFAVELIEKIRQTTENEFIIGYRMGGNEPSLENGIEIAKILVSSGVDLLHVSSGISDGTKPEVPEGFPYNYIVYNGTEIKKRVEVPVIVVNEITTAERAAYLVENGLADFTAIARGLLVDPEFAVKAERGEPARKCFKCNRCLWFTSSELCPGKA